MLAIASTGKPAFKINDDNCTKTVTSYYLGFHYCANNEVYTVIDIEGKCTSTQPTCAEALATANFCSMMVVDVRRMAAYRAADRNCVETKKDEFINP